jgi:hypothetical protein
LYNLSGILFLILRNTVNTKKELPVARAGNVIGGGDWSKDRIVPDIIRSLQQHKPIEVRNPGSSASMAACSGAIEWIPASWLFAQRKASGICKSI